MPEISAGNLSLFLYLRRTKKLRMSFFRKILLPFIWIRSHKYITVTVVFLAIVILIDDNSMLKHMENQKQISALKSEIAAMEKDSAEYEEKSSHLGSEAKREDIEEVGRERYDMHSPNEEIIVIR